MVHYCIAIYVCMYVLSTSFRASFLDQETSGIVLFSRTRNALTSLHELFRLRKVEKTYTAIVWGHLTDDEGQIDLPLARKPNSPPLYCVNTELGKPSLTKWVVRKRLENPPRTIVNLTPITGRSHQLRIHMVRTEVCSTM